MRIVTYNIHGWRTSDGRPNLVAVAETLARIGADIVGLNEVHYPGIVAGSDQPALEALAQRLGMHFVFGPCLRWPAQDNLPANAYGNALLSRWPIIASAAHHLTPKEEDQQHLLENKEQRGMLEGRIALPNGQTFTVYVLHLDHTDEAARSIQLRVARTWLGRDRNRPHLVLGDFNAITSWDFTDRAADWAALAAHVKGHNLTNGAKGPSVVDQMEKAGYTDIYRQFNPPGERSYLGADIAIRIDYLFASQSLANAVQTCAIWTEADGVSDHRPVVADLVT
jgi:endonuclease/exonuclease/phosphatase family metal-dependent hydrolase